MVAPLVAASDAVVNFAAESHVDRSILDPAAFLRTGVDGVHVLLEAIRREAERASAGERRAAPRFLQVSTDEVYGSVETGWSVETDPLRPRSPYAAAKAAGELLALAYHATYGLDVVVTRGSNTYGPYHHPEKLIPLFVTNALDDLPLPLYGDGLQRRDWLFVADHAGAVAHVLAHGVAGSAYNVPGSAERANRDVVARILDLLGKPWSLVRSVADRPGHDRRYAMDGSRLRELGWTNRVGFEEGLAATVAWYREHEDWWRAARGGDWDAYYARQYADRLAGSTAAETTAGGRGHRGGDPGPGGLTMRVAVTGAGGRLGRALLDALADARGPDPLVPLAWDVPDHDLDDPESPDRLVRRDRPDVVVHTAAWTDVDGCAREPALALRRNGTAAGELAAACVQAGVDLVHVSTNEVFDGGRTDGRGYRPEDEPAPINPYGASKRAGEVAVRAAFVEGGGVVDARRATAVAGRTARSSGSSGPRGSSARPATTSRPRSSRPPIAPSPPASRSASWATSSARRPTRRISPGRSSSSSLAAPLPASTTS